jgi:hypothetical protein
MASGTPSKMRLKANGWRDVTPAFTMPINTGSTAIQLISHNRLQITWAEATVMRENMFGNRLF